MKNHTINLRDLVILVADPNAYLRRVIHGMLRGFGANKVFEVANSLGLFEVADRTESRYPALRHAAPAAWRAQGDPHHSLQCP